MVRTDYQHRPKTESQPFQQSVVNKMKSFQGNSWKEAHVLSSEAQNHGSWKRPFSWLHVWYNYPISIVEALRFQSEWDYLRVSHLFSGRKI